MKKTKLKDRIKNAVNSFFDNEVKEDSLMNFDGNTEPEVKHVATEKIDFKIIFNILRQVFLFFPGAFVLWIMSLEFTYRFLMNASINHIIPIIALLISFFMVLLGLGDARRLRDYIIPTSTMGVGLLGALLFWLTGSSLFQLNRYGILFFPLALIAPFIVKFWIDESEEG